MKVQVVHESRAGARNRHKHDYGQYIRAISQCGDNINRALKIFQTMIDWNLSPNLHAFNALLSVAYKARNVSLCWDLFYKMKQQHGIHPNHETFHIVFGAMLKEQQNEDILQQFQDIVDQYRSLQSDSQYAKELLFTIYQTVPTTMIAAGKLKKPTVSREIFDEWFSRYPHDAHYHLSADHRTVGTLDTMYNSMINAMISVLTVNNDLDAAVHFLERILSDGSVHCDDAGNSEISDHSQHSEDSKVDKLPVFKYGDDRGFVAVLKSMGRIHRQHAVPKMLPIYDKALKWMDTGNPLSVELFNVMMTQCNASKQWTQSLSIYDDIICRQLRPDSITFIERLKATVYSLNLQRIAFVIDEIMTERRAQRLKVTPLLATCMMWSSIEAIRHPDLSRNQEKRMVMSPADIFAICKYEFGILPTTDMYNELLYVSMKFFDYKQALETLDDMKRWNLKLDTRTFNIFISGMGKLNRMDLIEELLEQMEECECPRNGATFMNLLDAAAQNGEIERCTRYLSEFEQRCAEMTQSVTTQSSPSPSTMGLYIDKNCYSHLVNCYANYFGNVLSSESMESMESMEFLKEKWRECLVHWNTLKANPKFSKTLQIADYILMLKCIKNYALNIERVGGDHREILDFAVDLFDNELTVKFGKDSGRNLRTSYNLLLDILYELGEVERGLRYFKQAQTIKVYKTLRKHPGDDAGFNLDLHGMTRYPAIFAVIYYLRGMQKTFRKTRGLQYEIITGVGASVDWVPVIKPIITELLSNGLNCEIAYHVPSYNEGTILLDNDSLAKCFRSKQVVSIKS